MKFLEMDQSAKVGEKWRRKIWVERKSSVYICPNLKPGRGWILFMEGCTATKMIFANMELNAEDWEKFE